MSTGAASLYAGMQMDMSDVHIHSHKAGGQEDFHSNLKRFTLTVVKGFQKLFSKTIILFVSVLIFL